VEDHTENNVLRRTFGHKREGMGRKRGKEEMKKGAENIIICTPHQIFLG
jgi:hypothetical protein